MKIVLRILLFAAVGSAAAGAAATREATIGLPVVAPGWKLEVVASAPVIQHPVTTLCAPDGRVFVCEHYMDMSAAPDQPMDRLLCFHPDGRITVFADKLYGVFGLLYLDGKLYVHHSPRFSVFDDAGDHGTNRVELVETTHPAPWGLSSRGKNQIHDHIPAGFDLAMDGYLYMAVGDKGLFGMVGRDGRRLDLPVGGVVRMRPDATELEVFATGFRTVLNPMINAEGEIFLYDNDDHKRTYPVAVGHVMDGGYYGYPWHHRAPMPDFVLPMAVKKFPEGGAPTATLLYDEDALPPKYHGNFFLCDWGRGELVRLAVRRTGATYETVAEEKILKGNFRPTGIALAPDGKTFFISDWAHPGWRSDAKVGRLLKLTYTGEVSPAPKPPWFLPARSGKKVDAPAAELVAGLHHPAKSVRLAAQRVLVARGAETVPLLLQLLDRIGAPSAARWHALWTLDAIDGGVAGRSAILRALADPDDSLRLQAIRELGTRRLPAAAPALQSLLINANAAVRYQAVTALGRIGQPTTVAALQLRLDDDDRHVRSAAFVALNRIGKASPAAWREIVAGLASDRRPLREGTSFALRETYDETLIAELAAFAGAVAPAAEVRAAAYAALFALHRMAPQWDGLWWRFGPLGKYEDLATAKPHVPQTRDWSGTAPVSAALRRALQDPAATIRAVAVEHVTLNPAAEAAPALAALYRRAESAAERSAVLTALGAVKSPEAQTTIVQILRGGAPETSLQIAALKAAQNQASSQIVASVAGFVRTHPPATVLAEALATLGALRAVDTAPLIEKQLGHSEPTVRHAAVKALAAIGGAGVAAALLPALRDSVAAVRGVTINALGTMQARAVIPQLLDAWRDRETRAEAAAALAQMPDVRALDVYLDGLGGRDPAQRNASRAALTTIKIAALPLLERKAKTSPWSPALATELDRIYGTEPAAAALLRATGAAPGPEAFAAFSNAQPGDPARGQQWIQGPLGSICFACHRIGEQGSAVGPDLTHIAAKYNRAELTDSVLYPSKTIADEFRLTIIATKDGGEVAGFVAGETETEIALLDASGRKHALAKSHVKGRRGSDRSLMPDGLQAGLTLQEFSDLISYLQTLK